MCACWIETEQTDGEREREMCVRIEQKLSRCRERERCVCARWIETEQMRRERDVCVNTRNRNWADTERERGVCACWESKTSRGCTGDSQRLNKVWALFLWKKDAKGVCNVAKLATLCISISPTTGWATGQTENTCCINRSFIKFVPLKGICVNALLTRY